MPITVSTETIKPLILDHMVDVIGHVIKLIRSCWFLSGHMSFKLKHFLSIAALIGQNLFFHTTGLIIKNIGPLLRL